MHVTTPRKADTPVLLRALFKILALSGALLTLSGCALNQNNQTLQAIQALETGLTERLQKLEQQNQQQNKQLDQLQQQAEQGDHARSQLQRTQQQLMDELQKQQRSKPQKSPANPVLSSRDKTVLGSQEWVWLDAAQQHYRARVDSGATTSSIHAPDPVFFERNGIEWVRFSLPGTKTADTETAKADTPADNNAAPKLNIEAPVVRWVRIIQASSDKAERRAVIEAWIQVGGLREKAEFTLADRSNMTFPILLGRGFFKDIALIDVGKTYIHPKQQPQQTTDNTSDD